MEFDNSLFASIPKLDDSIKEQMKKSMLANLGLEKDSYEGLTIKMDFNDKMVLTLTADLNKADSELLKKIGLDVTNADRSLKRAVADFKKESHGTCK